MPVRSKITKKNKSRKMKGGMWPFDWMEKSNANSSPSQTSDTSPATPDASLTPDAPIPDASLTPDAPIPDASPKNTVNWGFGFSWPWSNPTPEPVKPVSNSNPADTQNTQQTTGGKRRRKSKHNKRSRKSA